MAAIFKLLIFVLAACLEVARCSVIELDDRFLDARNQGMWLVEFYAPWCGHCKKLEPIYHQVALSLRSTPIKVAKIDCTRYSSVATEFGVRGFPTIKFINGENVYTHRGDRTKEDIMQFAIRAKGPAVRKLSSVGKFNEAKGDHSDGTFFLYVGDEDSEADLYVKYCDLAEKLIVSAYFYNGTDKILPKAVKLTNYPSILVFKDGQHYEYEAPDGMATKSSLEDWLISERLTAFPLVTGGTLNEIADIKKLLVMFVIDEEDKEQKTKNERIKLMGELLAKQHREQFHRHFQFVWMCDNEAVNSITMWSVSMPNILVLDPDTHLYYMPDNLTHITVPQITEFLKGVQNGTVQAHGGTGFLQRLKRVFYDLFTMVLSVWQASRWLFLLMFGLPTAIISIVCYSLCCMEPGDEDITSEDEDDEDREITPGEPPVYLPEGPPLDGKGDEKPSHPKSD